jgi:outer membrane cobalamin receptor
VARLYGSVLLTSRVTLRTRVENLFDERYEEVYGFPALGRSIHGGLSVGF